MNIQAKFVFCFFFSLDPVFRPVLIVGPLAECVTEKLIQDFPDKFTHCIPEVMHCPLNMMEKGISENIFVDFRKKGNNFECTTVTAVKEICDKVPGFSFIYPEDS